MIIKKGKTFMNHNPGFRKKLLASAITSCALAGWSLTASAQDTPMTEEVVVTGIKSSLQRAMDIKRDAKGVVDAISAEDIGKFPDTNLAESLQRITGVSIDRRNGEGYQVTVRGFGPEYNQVTLNGRTMPTAQLLETGGLLTSRAFDMSNIASEGVAGVTVYKSGQADITSGGIGATVDLRTRRPFDTAGFTASIGAKAVHDTTVRVGDDVTPEVNGFLSWSNDMFGAAIALSHQERDSARTGAFTNGWNERSGPWTGPGSIPNGVTDDVIIVNPPAEGTQTNYTPGLRYTHMDVERERQNAQVTLQYRPIDSVEATLDYVYANQELLMNRAEYSFWFGGGAFPTSAIEFETSNGVATPLYWLQENPDGTPRDVNFGIQGGSLENKLESVGFNVEWDVNDNLHLALDAHNSTAEALPGGHGPGNWYNVGIGGQGVSVQGIDNSGDLPLLVGVWTERADYPSAVPGEIDKSDIGSTVRQINYDRTKADITQIKIDGSWEFADAGSIDFGVESRDMEYANKSSFDQTLLEGGWGVATPGDVPPDMLEEINFQSLFDGYRSTMSEGARELFESAYGGGDLRAYGDTAYIADANELGAYLSESAGLEWAPNPVDSTDRLIEEDITSAYFQFDLNGELGDMPFSLLAGMRYESTDVKSTARVGSTSIIWQGDNDFLTQAESAADQEPLVFSESYDHMLPNLALSFNATDDVIVRAAWSTTIARADYAQLQEGVSGIGAPLGGPVILGGRNGTATNGNVGLLPVESDNFDVTVEWYYGDASYVSVGYFDKRVKNFIGTDTVETIADSTRDPSAGPRVTAAIAELEARDLEVNQQNLFRMVAALDDGSGGCVDADPNDSINLCGADFDSAPYEGAGGWENNVDIVALESDPLSVLDAATPVNKNDAHLSGFEFAVQHFFGDTGFGTQANYTIVNGDVGFDVATGPEEGAQFALTGLSDSANLVLIYDKYDWQARIAYNWRDSFLDSANVGNNEPQHTEAYDQVDFNVTYSITDNWNVGLEGINVLEEDRRQYGRTERQFRNLEILGARYALTTRYTF